MSVKVAFADNDSLVVVYLWGDLHPEEIVTRASEAMQSPRFAPAMDRLVRIHASASLALLDLPALGRVKDTVTQHEAARRPGDGILAFRTAFVAESAMSDIIVKLYIALRKRDRDVRPTQEVFPTVDSALGWLGRPDTRLPDWSAILAAPP